MVNINIDRSASISAAEDPNRDDEPGAPQTGRDVARRAAFLRSQWWLYFVCLAEFTNKTLQTIAG